MRDTLVRADRRLVTINTRSPMLKRQLQSAVRLSHLPFRRALPERLAIYLHDLPPQLWPEAETLFRFLRAAGYRFVGPDELCEGRTPLAFLSFDDNFRSWYKSIELLNRYEIRAVFYVNTLPFDDACSPADRAAYAYRIGVDPGSYDPLSGDELRALAAAGHEIGAHTHSHFRLAGLPVDQAQQEILSSKRILEDLIGTPVVHFSYPYGMLRFFSEDLRRFCLQAGFRTVANATPGLQYSGQVPAALQRTHWNLQRPLPYNVNNLRIDGRLFHSLTGFSATPC
ncbi:MAG: polysaccharide deacetylase family protein [Longimicrobiales bacterium]